jgi:UDP-N-acetylmuramyl pentapeptide phosphotransferase/UDP-N-acetylglucosamine-1-phosphate transferase
VIFSFLWAFVVSIFAIPSIIDLAYRKGILDQPNQRTSHERALPRLGGLAIFAGFMSAITIFANFGEQEEIQFTFASCILIFFIGFKDDILPVSAFKKFFVQIVAAGIVMSADIRLTSFYGFLGLSSLDVGTSYMITFIIIIGITNAINLIDGVDGLAGSLILLFCVIFGYYFYQEAETSQYFVLCSCLAGAVLGFLRYNFGSAKIFMGDTGSLVCGFIIAVLALLFVEKRPADLGDNAPALVFSILFLPIMDTTRVFVIRILRGRSPFAPDRIHVHHKLLDWGLSKPWVVIVLVLLNGLVFFSISQLLSLEINILMIILGFVGVTLSLVVELVDFLAKKRAVSDD